jgi:hypothetical protein
MLVDTVDEDGNESDEEEPVEPIDPDEEAQMDELDPEEIQALYDQFDGEDNEDDEPERLRFHKILDHSWREGILVLTVRYYDHAEEERVIAQPFSVMKRDVPVECARYNRHYVMDKSRRGYHMEWAAKTIKTHSRAIKRLYASYNINRIDLEGRQSAAPTQRSLLQGSPLQGSIPRNIRSLVQLRNSDSRFL